MVTPERIQSFDSKPIQVEEIVNWLSFFNRVTKEVKTGLVVVLNAFAPGGRLIARMDN